MHLVGSRQHTQRYDVCRQIVPPLTDEFFVFVRHALLPYLELLYQGTQCNHTTIWFVEISVISDKNAGLSIEGTVIQSHLPPFRNLGNFVHPTEPVSFGRDTKSRWSVLSGVYARGSKRSHTGGKCIPYSGFTNSRKDNSCVSSSLGCLEETT